MRENELTVLKSTEERVAQTSHLSVKRDAPPRLPPNEGLFLKGTITLEIWDPPKKKQQQTTTTTTTQLVVLQLKII